MSEENVDFVRRLWEAVARSQGVDETVLGFFTEDCVMEDFPERSGHVDRVVRPGGREHSTAGMARFRTEKQERDRRRSGRLRCAIRGTDRAQCCVSRVAGARWSQGSASALPPTRASG
jgi:hypothetical protein